MDLKNKVYNVNYNEATLLFLFLYLSVTFFSVAISNICLGIACFTFLLGIISKQIHFKGFDFKTYVAIITPFILTLVSTISSSVYDAGIGYLNLRLPILIVPLIILCLNLDKKHLKKGFSVLFFAAFLASVLTFYNVVKYFNEDILLQTDFTYFITPIHHPYFGIYLLIAILGLLEFNILPNNYLKILAVLVLSTAIFFTTSRIVYILYFLVVLGYCFTKLSIKRFRYLVLIIGVLSSTLIVSNKNIFNKFINTFNDNSPRLKLWTNSLEAVKRTDSYVFGIGIGDYYKEKKDVYFSEYYGRKTIGVFGFNPHSQIVEYYVTNGFLGLLILTIAFWIYLSKLKSKNLMALSIFSIIFLFASVECIFNRQYGVQLYSVIIPLIIGYNFNRN